MDGFHGKLIANFMSPSYHEFVQAIVGFNYFYMSMGTTRF